MELDGIDAPDASGANEQEALVEELLRPNVPMGFYVGAPYAAALGICEALRDQGYEAWIVWPHDVVVTTPEGSARIAVTARGGYDDDGMFCRVEGRPQEAGALSEMSDVLTRGVRDRFSAWEDGVRANHGAAGPLAAFLSDYFDLVGLMGKPVEARYPNGRVMARGRLSGMDVWGRASLTLDDGHELTITPEQASIHPARDGEDS